MYAIYKKYTGFDEMNVMFHDIHLDKELEEELEENQVIGAMIHELLYADDTIIYSRSPETLTKLLQKIQKITNSFFNSRNV